MRGDDCFMRGIADCIGTSGMIRLLETIFVANDTFIGT